MVGGRRGGGGGDEEGGVFMVEVVDVVGLGLQSELDLQTLRKVHGPYALLRE